MTQLHSDTLKYLKYLHPGETLNLCIKNGRSLNQAKQNYFVFEISYNLGIFSKSAIVLIL